MYSRSDYSLRLLAIIRRSFGLLLLVNGAQAELHLASPFTDHMVLQRQVAVPVWGTATAGATVTVAFAGQTKSATVTGDGVWRVSLDPLETSAESQTFSVTEAPGPSAVALHDVLVGEVWLCSGQSNMDFTVAKTPKYYFAGVNNEAEEVAAANYPTIRMFTGAATRAYEPQKQVAGTWKICTPENVREFSAIGYFFARDLQRELNVPIGLVTLSFGASTAQAWIRREALAADPELRPLLESFDAQVKSYVPPTAEESKEIEDEAAKAKAAGLRPPRRRHSNPTQDQHNPTVLFNGMIAPVVPYALRGILWYQGESITPPRELFPKLNETLITDWRKLWGSALPFYFCQLAALQANSNSPQVREWQTEALKLPNTAMAVTIDIGDPKDVHPHNKQDVGDRLARIALAKNYGKQIEYSGPEYKALTPEDSRLRVTFTHLAGGLVARAGALKTFEVAGEHGEFAAADAVIEGATVLVSSPKVLHPVAVRYAWSNYPEGCNLYNQAGLPAAPFQAGPRHP